MAMHPRKIANAWFLHEFERFNSPKMCPCCRETYVGWGCFSHSFFQDRVCDDCYANVIIQRIRQSQADKAFAVSHQLRLQQVKQLQALGKIPVYDKVKK